MMKISQLCKELNLDFIGEDKEIIGFNSLELATSKEASYVDNEKYKNKISTTKAGVLILQKSFSNFANKNTSLIISENPHLSFAYGSCFFKKNNLSKEDKEANIHDDATIYPNVYTGKNSTICANVVIMPGVFIGENVFIDEGTIIHPNAVIYNDTKIGKRCHILANAVIGSDGFGYAHTKNGEHIKIYHNGNVILEDDVEIGSCTTIDRSVFESTIIRKGSKIDNLVQIGHNCELGEHCLIVSQAGLAGSTKLGRNVVMGGQSGTSGHVSIGDFAQIAARGGVSKNLEGNKIYSGFPIMPHKEWLKIQVKINKFFNKKLKEESL